MASVDEVQVGYSRKVQLDDFEPVEAWADITVSIDGDDDPDDVYDEYSDMVEDMVEREIAERITQKKLADSDE